MKVVPIKRYCTDNSFDIAPLEFEYSEKFVDILVSILVDNNESDAFRGVGEFTTQEIYTHQQNLLSRLYMDHKIMLLNDIVVSYVNGIRKIPKHLSPIGFIDESHDISQVFASVFDIRDWDKQITPEQISLEEFPHAIYPFAIFSSYMQKKSNQTFKKVINGNSIKLKDWPANISEAENLIKDLKLYLIFLDKIKEYEGVNTGLCLMLFNEFYYFFDMAIMLYSKKPNELEQYRELNFDTNSYQSTINTFLSLTDLPTPSFKHYLVTAQLSNPFVPTSELMGCCNIDFILMPIQKARKQLYNRYRKLELQEKTKAITLFESLIEINPYKYILSKTVDTMVQKLAHTNLDELEVYRIFYNSIREYKQYFPRRKS